MSAEPAPAARTRRERATVDGGPAIAAGIFHSIVLRRDGNVLAFGNDEYGVLGTRIVAALERRVC